MFDTHCHLNFKVFDGKVLETVKTAKKVGVNYFVVPGTDVESSQKAVAIASKFENVFAAVGIHPHHVYQINQKRSEKIRESEISPPKADRINQKNSDLSDLSDISGIRSLPISSDYSGLSEIEKLLSHPKVVAVGEIGIDRHYYQKTKYPNYQIDEDFINLQKLFFVEQIKLAKKYNKTLIIHNRQAKKELLKILTNYRLLITKNRCVFHCCEPDDDLLEFAKKYRIFIGVDGDVTYPPAGGKKQEFVKKVPLELLVLETDSPFLTPRLFPPRSLPRYNEPKNLPIIAEFIAKLVDIPTNQLIEAATENAKRLFNLI